MLVVEDDQAIRSAIAQALQEAGHSVVEASDGMDALRLAEAHHPRVIVLDLGLRVMDGSVFMMIYRQSPGTRAPIVIVSAQPDATMLGERLGAAACIKKPFLVDDLIRVVDGLVHSAG